jgi:hypothetical protein
VSSKNLNSVKVKNKQELFDKNYSLVGDILNENFNVSNDSLQRKIELALLEQDKFLFTPSSRAKFTKDSYNLLTDKYDVLCKLLKYPKSYLKTLNYGFISSKYLPNIF